MWYNWCIASNNTTINATLQDFDYRTSLQRYGQYELQFIDYNSDADYNSSTDAPRSRWDEDNSRNNPSSSFTFHFIWDDDDLYLWQWPEAFSEWINTWEFVLEVKIWPEDDAYEQ